MIIHKSFNLNGLQNNLGLKGSLLMMANFIWSNGKVCSTIDIKSYLLAPKWDTLMKHEGRRKACIEGFSKAEDHERRLVQQQNL